MLSAIPGPVRPRVGGGVMLLKSAEEDCTMRAL